MSVWSAFLGKTPPPWSNDPNEVMKGNTSAGYVIGNSMGQALFGQNYDAVKQFNSRDRANLDAWRVASLRLDFGEPYTANLADFQKSGGKVLFWNGVSDPCCSDVELEQYYRDSAKFVSGGMSALPAFMRYYRVPGMAHCGGGTGPGDAPDELLDALIAWVEQGKAPGDVVAHRGVDREKLQFADPKTKVVSGVLVPPPSGQSRDFLLCPFPKTAVFNGSKAPGAVNDAANWSCKGGPAGALASR
jgi:feruloyl esterase